MVYFIFFYVAIFNIMEYFSFINLFLLCSKFRCYLYYFCCFLYQIFTSFSMYIEVLGSISSVYSIGISIVERLRDRGFDSIICFDDFSKHSKVYLDD